MYKVVLDGCLFILCFVVQHNRMHNFKVVVQILKVTIVSVGYKVNDCMLGFLHDRRGIAHAPTHIHTHTHTHT